MGVANNKLLGQQYSPPPFMESKGVPTILDTRIFTGSGGNRRSNRPTFYECTVLRSHARGGCENRKSEETFRFRDALIPLSRNLQNVVGVFKSLLVTSNHVPLQAAAAQSTQVETLLFVTHRNHGTDPCRPHRRNITGDDRDDDEQC